MYWVFGWLSVVEGSSLSPEWPKLGDNGGAHGTSPVKPIAVSQYYGLQTYGLFMLWSDFTGNQINILENVSILRLIQLHGHSQQFWVHNIFIILLIDS